MKNLTEMLKGVLEGCLLEIISRGETYGYEITRRLNALGFTDVVDGTTYTILVRLEKNKLVNVDKRQSDMGPPRKFFTLNEAGREELRLFWAKWEFIASKIGELRPDRALPPHTQPQTLPPVFAEPEQRLSIPQNLFCEEEKSHV